MLEWSLKTVTTVGTGKSIDFYIFDKVGYYCLLPLACICIDYYSLTVVVYCHSFYFTLRIPMFNHMVFSIIEPYHGLMCHAINYPLTY